MFFKKNGAKALFLILMILTQVHCAKPNPVAQDSCGFNQNDYGQRISWKQASIKVYVDPAFPAEFRGAITSAISKWNAAIGRQSIVFMGERSGGSSTAADGVNTIYWKTNWNFSAKEQANTLAYWVDNQIIEADMAVNANFSYSLSPNYGQVDIEALLIHEFGHVLGLKHLDSEPSVMATNLSDGPQNQRKTLYPIDATDIKCEY